MKRAGLAVLVLLVLTLCLTPACSIRLKNRVSASNGTMKDGTYTNEFFGISFSIPDGWTVATNEEMDRITNMGSEVAAGNNEDLKKELERGNVKVLDLLFAFRYPLNHTGSFNYNFMCMAEELGGLGKGW
jgi:hypothetical protein